MKIDLKYKKIVFGIFIFISFFAVWLLNFFTPYLSDDLIFDREVRGANSLGDLFNQQYTQYMTQNGRAVLHMFVRLSFCIDKSLFNVINSIMFVLLTLLMYANIEKKEKYDVKVLTLITVLVWLFGVSFDQTVLWETGACNYLWGTTLILGFVSLIKYMAGKAFNNIAKTIAFSVLAFLVGVLAGWCNENTSGGGMLLVASVIVYDYLQKKKVNISMLAGLGGMITGFLFMIMAPGYRLRSVYMDEEYSGILRYFSRFYKCTLEIREHFFVLLALLVVFFFVARMQKVEWKTLRNSLTFMIVGFATCYALVLSPTPMSRVYFGAGIFFVIACVQCFVNIKDENIYIPAIKLSFISVLCLFVLFEYVEEGMNVARIGREYNEREEYILEQKAAGEIDIVVPMLRPQFETKYSFGYDSDIQESSEYWMNIFFAEYYEVNSITGVPREDWTEY